MGGSLAFHGPYTWPGCFPACLLSSKLTIALIGAGLLGWNVAQGATNAILPTGGGELGSHDLNPACSGHGKPMKGIVERKGWDGVGSLNRPQGPPFILNARAP